MSVWQILVATGMPTAVLIAAVAASFAATRRPLRSAGRHPADRATYHAPCGHLITGSDPFALAANQVAHAQLCPTPEKVR